MGTERDRSLAVRGGLGGFAVGLDDLESAAARVGELALEAGTVAREIALLAARVVPGLTSCVVHAPDLASRAEAVRLAAHVEALLVGAAGTRGAAGEASALTELAVAVRATTSIYRGVDAGVVAPIHRAAGDLARGSTLALAEAARLGGVLDEAGSRVVVTPTSATTARAPTSVADLVGAQEDLGPQGGEARVRVVEVPHGDGSAAWVVEIPGTQDWGADAGGNPFDVTTDVALMAGEPTAAAAGIRQALAAAQRSAGRTGAGDPVMLVGHSEGGILAAALASDPLFRAGERVTHVVTSGAPVAGFAIPEEVSVLSLEHGDDVVPRLDGAVNPDRATWVTVTRPGPQEGARRVPSMAAHGSEEYAETAADVDALIRAGRNVSLDAWADGASAFLGASDEVARGDATVREYRIQRVDVGRSTG